MFSPRSMPWRIWSAKARVSPSACRLHHSAEGAPSTSTSEAMAASCSAVHLGGISRSAPRAPLMAVVMWAPETSTSPDISEVCISAISA